MCGVLIGSRADPDESDAVRDARPVPNVAADPRTHYELDPEATLAEIEAAEAAGDDVVGFYHSHPRGPPEPSDTDRRQATWPGYVYCIVVPGSDEDEEFVVRAWRWTGEAFESLTVEVVDD